MEYHGQMALQIGILVAFTQLVPEHQVQVLGIIKCRVKVRAQHDICNLFTDGESEDAPYGLCHLFYGHMYPWVSVPIHHHPVRIPVQLGMVALLQEEHH